MQCRHIQSCWWCWLMIMDGASRDLVMRCGLCHQWMSTVVICQDSSTTLGPRSTSSPTTSVRYHDNTSTHQQSILFCWARFIALDDPNGLLGGNAPWFMCWFQRYINRLFVYLLNFLPHFIPSLIFSFCMRSFLLIYFLTRLLPDLSIYSFQNRPVPFPGWRS